ncbi:CapA family protein [Bradyrhizobium sp. UFLA05-109]
MRSWTPFPPIDWLRLQSPGRRGRAKQLQRHENPIRARSDSYEADLRDVAGILRNIRRGEHFADFCIVTNHGHYHRNWSQEPPDYERSSAHRLIDNGARTAPVAGHRDL